MSKVPRVDYEKYLRGGAAGRRTLVDGLGDALREQGCARVQGHGLAAGDPGGGLAEVGRELLAAIEAYFGLPTGSLLEVAAAELRPHQESPAAAVLLTLVPEVASGLQVRRGGGQWQPVAANPGELLVVPGAALASLTGGIVPVVELRAPSPVTGLWCLASRRATPPPRPEFLAGTPPG
jgi:isopenicillin N synthase-like dioxygenase